MFKKLSFVFFTLSSLSLLTLNILSALSIDLGLIFNLTCSIMFGAFLILAIALTIIHILKTGKGESGYFKKTKVIDILLLCSALLYFVATFIKIGLLVAIFFPLIIYFFELHVLFNSND